MKLDLTLEMTEPALHYGVGFGVLGLCCYVLARPVRLTRFSDALGQM